MPDEVAREIQEAMQAQTRGGQVPPLEMLVVYAVDTARAIFRDAERVADEDEQKKIAE